MSSDNLVSGMRDLLEILYMTDLSRMGQNFQGVDVITLPEGLQ